MTADDPRWRDGVTAAIAALQAGESHRKEDIEAIRREIRRSEERVRAELVEVNDECKEFRVEVRERWDQEREERETRKASSKAVVIAAIGASAAVLASIIAAAAVILTGGG